MSILLCTRLCEPIFFALHCRVLAGRIITRIFSFLSRHMTGAAVCLRVFFVARVAKCVSGALRGMKKEEGKKHLAKKREGRESQKVCNAILSLESSL